MKDDTVEAMITSLPDKAAVAGVRAYILHEGLRGNLEDATKAYEQVWACDGYGEIKAELTEYLVARYAFRGNLKTAQNFMRVLPAWILAAQPCKRKLLRLTSSHAWLWT